MKIYSKIVIDLESGDTLYEDSFDYSGELALCGKGGSDGDSVVTQRYAPYVEDRHKSFLDAAAGYRTALTDDSPFVDYEDIDIEDAFFGAGYAISSFPSLYDMYGKFMAGLDIDVLYSQIFEDTVNAPEINDLVAAEATLLDDDIEANVLPPYLTGMRTTNSVMSSTFVIGTALIKDTRVKLIEKFSAELKYRMIPVVSDRWKAHLGWNKDVVMNYAEIMKLYFSAKMDTDDINYTMAAKDKLWPFTVLEYERAALGALQGATTTTSDVAGASHAQRAISGALSGAAGGAMIGSMMAAEGATGLAAIGGPVPIGIGALLGLGSALL